MSAKKGFLLNTQAIRNDMRILILTNNDLGLYRFRRDLIEELLKENEVFISLPDGDFVEDLVKLGCKFVDTKIDRRSMNSLRDISLFFEYNKILKDVKPDLVITYTIKPNIYGGLISRIRNVDYVANITGLGTGFQKEGLLKRFIIRLYKIALKNCRVIFFENEDNQNSFINSGITTREKTFKLSGAGVNLTEHSFVQYPEECNAIRFLFIGRLMKEKGLDEFLEVAEKIKSENKKIQFDIIGPNEEDYNNRIEHLQQKKIINYYGYQKHVRPFVKSAHCLVLPSYHEGMANALLECGAMGRPLITSNIPGCKEAVIDGQNGYLTNVADINDLYINMKKFIDLDYGLKAEMGRVSRLHIESTFDKQEVVRETIGVLSKEITDRKTHGNIDIETTQSSYMPYYIRDLLEEYI